MALTDAQVLIQSTPLANAAHSVPTYASASSGLLPVQLLAVAVLKAALQIATEISTTANYTNRQKWVNAVTSGVEGPLLMATRMHAAVCMTDPAGSDLSAGNTPSDADLLSTVAALIDTFAGRI